MNRNLYYYEYVHLRGDDVIRTLRADSGRLFDRATAAAVEETGVLAGKMHVELAGLEVGKDVRIELGEIEVEGHRATLPIRWRAASRPGLFPSMDAELVVEPMSDAYPLSQLSLVGRYRPPMSVLGALGDALLGHRLAEAAVHNFLTDLVARLEEIGVPAGRGAKDAVEAVRPQKAGRTRDV